MPACSLGTGSVGRLVCAQLEPAKARALLVADEALGASLARQVLRKLGFATVAAPSAERALGFLAADSFSVIVLDLGRADLVAGGTLRAVEEAARATPIVVLCEASALAERLRPWRGRRVHVLDRHALDLARLTAAIRFAADGGLVGATLRAGPRPAWPERAGRGSSGRPPRNRGWSRRG